MRAPASLSEFISLLESRGQLRRINEEVERNLEITALSEPIMKAGGPALVFENVKHSAFALAINLLGSEQRLAWAMGENSLDEIVARLRLLMAPPQAGGNVLERVGAAWPKLKLLKNLAPAIVKQAPCQQVVLSGPEASLAALPILTCWPEDGGPFITLPQVITMHPESKVQNWGMYRMQVYDERTTGMHWHAHKGGAAHYACYKQLGIERMPVAVALGGPPAAVYAATAPWPDGLDEALLTGFIMNRPLELVKARQSELLVPASAEFILEGYVDTNEALRAEGPFGDHTGFYSPIDHYPVFHLTAVTRREKPVYPATIVGIPPMEDYWLGQCTEKLFLPMLQMLQPEITDFHLPAEGVFHNLALVSIKKSYPGQAFKVMNAMWGQGQMMFSKMIVVVDEQVDLRAPGQAWWYALSNFDPTRDLLLTKGPADALDHASAQPLISGKLGIDGTAKLPGESSRQPWPRMVSLPPQLRQSALQRLKQWKLL